ncbi:hypothetical protein FRC06_008483 [Ceratobasidium sp. 370]|nr:hypothetical protein FRC06_008483 [Ceratobasidium sp. 370]
MCPPRSPGPEAHPPAAPATNPDPEPRAPLALPDPKHTAPEPHPNPHSRTPAFARTQPSPAASPTRLHDSHAVPLHQPTTQPAPAPQLPLELTSDPRAKQAAEAAKPTSKGKKAVWKSKAMKLKATQSKVAMKAKGKGKAKQPIEEGEEGESEDPDGHEDNGGEDEFEQ